MKTGRAAVMTAVGKPLEIREYPLVPVDAGHILVRVLACTICKSDLHTWTGRRHGPVPVILGHEIVGEIVELGRGRTHDAGDRPISVGDRITWTLIDSCGTCFYCREKGLPMKCRSLTKYGHDACDEPPHFRGGFAEYCYITPGTCVIKLPEGLRNETAAPANCALATVIAGWEAGRVTAGEHVLVQGAGGLGRYAAVVASTLGCRSVIVTDVDAERLAAVKRFGATATVDARGKKDGEIASIIREMTDGFGVDCVIEVAGVPSLIAEGLACLRKGGRFVEVGCSFPDARVTLDVSLLLWNMLELRGVHNYDTRHLERAVRFLEETRSRFPFDEMVHGRVFSLDEINEAMELAESGIGARVAIVP